MVALLGSLTTELAREGYTASETFGYTLDQLEQSPVHLVGARVHDQLIGLGGLELQQDGVGELKRFFVIPEHRGSGVADALIIALIEYAQANHVQLLRLETGDKQHVAIAFYRRHGFVEIPRFGPYVRSAASYCMQRTSIDGGQGRPRSESSAQDDAYR